MKSQIVHLFLTLFIILLIYCIMYYFIYKPTEIKFDTDTDTNNNYYYDYKNSNSHNHRKLQQPEVFYDITLEEATKNLNDLQNLQTYLQTYNDNYLQLLEPIINDAQDQVSTQEQSISTLLTNRYIIQYLDIINKANATAYREYALYKEREKINIL